MAASSWFCSWPAAAAAGAGGAAVGGVVLLPALSEMGLLGWFLVDLAINVGGWAVASALKTEKFFDALGTVSFLTLTAGSLAAGPITARKVLMSVMVGVWAVRLGSYLVARIHRAGKDVRFDTIKHQPLTFLFTWVMQAVWVFATLSPVLIVNLMPATAPLCALDALGVAIFSLGFGFEVVSDWQKDAFRSDPANKGRFITEGLWSTSRHPNYFGESLLWWGVFACAAASFTAPVQWASAVGPAFVFLLVRFGSGVPLLEKSGDAKWGGQPDYEAYKAATPVFFPKLPTFGGGGAGGGGYAQLPREGEASAGAGRGSGAE